MIFYGVFTKVGSAIQGWINGNYDPLTPVKPRVYHKYLKDSDKANLYPTKESEGEDPATLGALTVASVAGSTSGTTAISVTEAIASGNVYKYKLGTAAETVTVDQDLSAWTDWDGTADITVTAETAITVAECTAAGLAVNAGSATIVANTVAGQSLKSDDEDPMAK